MTSHNPISETNQDLISVIVPVYNTQDYLDDCLITITGQTYHNLEILLVDDGSTDGSLSICESWKDRDARIRVIHQENKGLSEARNIGTRAATGNFIAYIDSDDCVDKEYIEALHQMLEEAESAGAAACQFLRTENPKGQTSQSDHTGSSRLINAKNFHFSETDAKIIGTVVWNKLYRSFLAQNHSFPVGRLHEDEFYTYRLVEDAKNIIVTDRVLYYYRVRNGSIISNPLRGAEDALDARLEKIHFLQKRYPSLIIREKLILVNLSRYYEKLLKNSDVKNPQEVRRMLSKKRKEADISASDLRLLNGHDFLVVLYCMVRDAICRW